MLKIGVIKEGKQPPDYRVPLTPEICRSIMDMHDSIEIVVESCSTRCFKDEEYQHLSIPVVHDVSDCDVLLGVKEVPIDQLIPNKTYFFFSHTIKKQPYNQPLMHALMEKGIRMIDYETLVDDAGKRLIGFGYFAGVVGAHNALLTYGQKFNQYNLPPAHQVKDLATLKSLYQNITFPALKVAVTGAGKVSHGAWDILNAAGFKEVSPEDYLSKQYNYPVFTKLTVEYLYQHQDTGAFDKSDFYSNPSQYTSAFLQYAPMTDILINGIFWRTDIVRLFENKDVQIADFNIKVIADVTCDINGSVPLNQGASTIADPVYGIDKATLQRQAAFQNTSEIIDLMAVDNLPNELPRDASAHFSKVFKEIIIPELLLDNSTILEKATICQHGKLTPRFEYLSDYASTNQSSN